MKKTVKRLLALGMTLSIAVGMFPVTALAVGDMPDSYDFRGKSPEQVSADWEIFGPDANMWSVDSDGLTLKTHDGDIYTTKESAKNIFYQETVAGGTWVAETKITLGDDFDGNFQQGAILAYGDNDNYVKFSYEYNNGKMLLQLASEVEGGITSNNRDVLNQSAAGTVVYLQLTKNDNEYSAAYSVNGVTFTPVCDPVTNEMAAPKLAITANNGADASTANKSVTFAYVAAMTEAQAKAVEDLEKAIAVLPADVNAVTTAHFDAIDAAKAQYDADALSGLALRDTLVNESAHLKALVDQVAVMRADIAAADAAKAKIAAIGEVALTTESKGKIAEARTAYDALTPARKALISDEELAVLTKAEDDYDKLAAADVDAKITEIGTPVTLDSKTKIEAARKAFDDLTAAQEALVTNKATLEAAEAALASLEAVAGVEAKITAIGTPITMSSKAKIDAARAAYNALSDDTEKSKVTNYTTLTTAETVFAVVKKIDDIDTVAATTACKEKIDAARIAYTDLTNDQKAMVGNYSTLQDAEKVYSVMNLINQIGTPVTLNSKDKIAAARTAYDALTSAQKNKVSNSSIDTLKAAEVSYVKSLIDDIGTVTLDSKTKIETARAAYDKLPNTTEKNKVTNYSKLTAAEKSLADLTAADAVDAKIDAIGTVEATTACKAKIDAARTAYDALTTEQKALVQKYDDLLNAEELYALLTALGNVCDGGTGCPAFLLTDVDPDQWYHKAVDYVLTEGLFKGISNTQFAPNNTMTRAMIWTVLARMDDANLAVTTPWYKSAQNWAVYNQVSDGTTPDGSVTREQLVTMLWRFMDEPQANGSLAGYPDAGKVSSWAKEAMTWAVANGVVQGVGNANGTVTLNPGATATRAQVAQMFMNFLTK